MANITKEEMQEITKLKDNLGRTISESGQTSLQIQLLESDILELKKKLSDQTLSFKKILEEEQELINRLSVKYGAGTINYDTVEYVTEKY